jgi:flagellar hook-associated protein 2
MANVKNTMERYASTSIGNPGVLVKKAGSTFSSTSLLNNAVQKQIEGVQNQIEKWQTKMSSKIDYYTRQFTALEKLMNTMNSQSSALSGLMGGY